MTDSKGNKTETKSPQPDTDKKDTNPPPDSPREFSRGQNESRREGGGDCSR